MDCHCRVLVDVVTVCCSDVVHVSLSCHIVGGEMKF